MQFLATTLTEHLLHRNQALSNTSERQDPYNILELLEAKSFFYCSEI